MALWKAPKFLDRANIKFQPGLNEDLAATAIWGSQQVNLYPGANVDGVFAMWYGKGPGVDRCGDVFKHANFAGTSKHGGVLVLAGDDHAAKSSTLPHQSDHQFSAAMIPVLYPSSVQEIIDLGLHGWAMSRYSGCWVGFKCVSDTVESSASVSIDPERVKIVVPDDFPLPPDGVSIRWPDAFLATEARMQDYKAYAALHYCRVNQLNRIVIDSPKPRLGIITSGKSYLDVRQALDDLGITEADAAEIGIRVFKVAMPWPLEPEGVRQFAEGLDEILVVEEKRQIVEYQLKEQLYNWRDDVRPRVIGKFDEKGEWVRPHGDWLLPPHAELTPAMIARVIAQRIERLELHPRTIEKIRQRVDFINQKERCARPAADRARAPAVLLLGLPAQHVDQRARRQPRHGRHRLPRDGDLDGSQDVDVHAHGRRRRAVDRPGAVHRREARLREPRRRHLLPQRHPGDPRGRRGQGQHHLQDPLQRRRRDDRRPAGRRADLARATSRASARPKAWRRSSSCPTSRKSIRAAISRPTSRSIRATTLDAVQRKLRETSGTTILLYDQTCAAEKRRRRKRGKFADPAKRVVINELVCEGCGDCGVKSNCVSVAPVETEFGRKRTIDQSSCNKDYSCVNGFCPSFVTVEGGQLRKPKKAEAVDFSDLPAPAQPATREPYGVLVTGIGGTGVVTIGALLGMAAHLEGKGCSVLDMTGLAQKNGAVVSHVRIADTPEQLYATRIAAGEAKLVLACDILTGVGHEALAKMQKGVTKALVNTALVMPAQFTRDPDLKFPDRLDGAGDQGRGRRPATPSSSTRRSSRPGLMGDSIATNLFMVGYAYQRGLVPVGEAAILRAIELNGAAVESNKQSFYWGRLAAVEPARVAAAAIPTAAKPDSQRLSESLDEMIERRATFLTDYQDAAYAKRYTDFVAKVRAVEAAKQPGATDLTEAVARYYFKLLAIKDEYEVARLYAETDFVAARRRAVRRRLHAQFPSRAADCSTSRRPTTASRGNPSTVRG